MEDWQPATIEGGNEIVARVGGRYDVNRRTTGNFQVILLSVTRRECDRQAF